MNWLKWVKIFKAPSFQKKDQKEYRTFLNEIKIEKVISYSRNGHKKTYDMLRAFKSSQYDKWFVLRNKKGFNTFYFTINYDVIIADKDGKIIDKLIDVSPGYFSEYYNNSYYIYFIPVGSIKHHNIKKTDILRIFSKIF